jgi:hypothetical protein
MHAQSQPSEYRGRHPGCQGQRIYVDVGILAARQYPPQNYIQRLRITDMLILDKYSIGTSDRFNKGVDFVGDVGRFNKEFEEDVCIIRYCVKKFGLPENLKLSVHSGSDKFSIYPGINRTLKKNDVGLHVKTAGTTWLEELIGLAKSGEDGLNIAKEVYCKSLDRMDELCGPYATVIDIDESRLPSNEAVGEWNGKAFSDALKHDQTCAAYNPHFRQLLHIGYKIAAEMGNQFTDALKNYESAIAPLVTESIYERHIKPIFR